MVNGLGIKALIEELGLSVRAFEKRINAGDSAIQKTIARNSEIKQETADKIMRTFPQVSKVFLESGKLPRISANKVSPSVYSGTVQEESLKYNEAIELEEGAVHKSKSGNEFIDVGHGMYLMVTPLVHEYAYGGYLHGFSDPQYIEDLPRHAIVVKATHRGVYRTFVMIGDSMDDGSERAIKSGDKVTGRLIIQDYWKSKLHFRDYSEFVIHHKEGIIVKEIIAHDVDKGIITIRSRNPDKTEYPDDTINLSDCKELYNVIEVSKSRK